MNNPVFPPLPSALPALEGPESPPLRAGAAGSELFSLAGRRATAWGSALRGVQDIHAGRWTLLAGVETGLGVAATGVVGPSSIRREVLGTAGSVLETVLLPTDVAGAALQWARPAGARAPLRMVVEWSMAWDGALGYAYERLDYGVLVSARIEPPEPQPAAAVLIHPLPAQLQVSVDGGGARVRAVVDAGEGAAVTLLLAGGKSREEAARTLAALLALRALERRAEQEVVRARDEGLSVAAAPDPLPEALEWAKARARAGVALESRIRRLRRGGGACPPEEARASARAGEGAGETSPFGRAAEAAWLALGALAGGDAEPARILLEREATSGLELLVAGRYAAWTGDRLRVLRHRQAALELCERLAEPRPKSSLLQAAARELADAFDVEDRELASRLRSAAASAPGVRPGRALPMVRRDGGDDSAHDALLRALFDPAPFPYVDGAAPSAGGVERALRAWARCRAGNPDQGGRLLIEHAAAGFTDGAGLWRDSPHGDCADHAASAALLPAALLFGLLGGAADASVGRVRLSPRIPAGWSTLTVAGIRVGDARLRVEYRRNGGEHTFALRQEAGRSPLMLVLAPEVAEPRLAHVTVDGSPAELDTSSRAGWSRSAVQLPLDAARVVTLVGSRDP